MRAEIEGWYTLIFLTDEEVKELCRPGTGADTCIWLVMGQKGWECCYHDRRGVNLIGETLEERLQKGLTVAKRDGCDKVKNLPRSFFEKGGVQEF